MQNKQKTNAFEFKLNTNSGDHFKTTMGIFNIDTPISLYLSISSWVEHTGDFKQYQNNVLELKNKIRLKLKKLIKEDNIFDSNFIFDFKIKKALRHEDKIVFSCIDITLKQKNLLMVADLESVMVDFSNNLLYMLENQPNFEFKEKVKVI